MVNKSRFWKDKEGEKARVSKREITNKNALRKQHILDLKERKERKGLHGKLLFFWGY